MERRWGEIKEKVTIKKYGEEKVLAEEIVEFLNEKDITYKEAIEALKDAKSFLTWASLQCKI